MKLFQKMLVAGASVSLLAPIAVQASDVMKLNPSTLDSSSFTNNQVEDIENLKSIVKELQSKIDELDGLQPNQSEFEAGSFSTTTSMDGKAIFWVGGIDGINEIDDDEDGSLADEPSEGVQTGYTYTMNLNTSFSGDDNLYVRLKSGNSDKKGSDETDLDASPFSTKSYGTYLSSTNTNSAYTTNTSTTIRCVLAFADQY